MSVVWFSIQEGKPMVVVKGKISHVILRTDFGEVEMFSSHESLDHVVDKVIDVWKECKSKEKLTRRDVEVE